MKLLPILALTAGLIAGGAQAATLSLGGLPFGAQGNTTVVVPEATITSFGTDLFFGGASFVPNSFCALNSGNCEADLEITFSSVVSNLFLQVSGFDGGDFVSLSLFDGLNAFIGSVNLIDDVASLDLSGFGSIGRLFFDDSSTGAGFAYSDFSFDQGPVIPPVPLPASLPLLAAGLGLVAAMRRRKA